MSGVAFESEASRRRRSRFFSLVALVLVTAAPLGLLFLSLTWPALVGAAPLTILAGVLLWGANIRPRERLGRLEVGDLGLFFDKRRLAARSEIRAATIAAQSGDAPLVRLTMRGRSLEFRVANALAARRLVHAIGAHAQVLAWRLPSRAETDPGKLARLALLAFLAVGLFPLLGIALHQNALLFGAVFAAAGGSVALVLGNLLSTTEVSLLPDGLRLRWLFRERFIPYDAIASAQMYRESRDGFGTATDQGLSLQLTSGEVLRLPRHPSSSFPWSELCERVQDALAKRPLEGSGPESVLSSGGRSIRDWLRALRSIGSGSEVDHRTPPVPNDVLWRIVEDTGADPQARAGAAVALRDSLDEIGRARLRIAAEAAAPRLRVALETTATATDDAELEHALSEVEGSSRHLVAT